MTRIHPRTLITAQWRRHQVLESSHNILKHLPALSVLFIGLINILGSITIILWHLEITKKLIRQNRIKYNNGNYCLFYENSKNTPFICINILRTPFLLSRSIRLPHSNFIVSITSNSNIHRTMITNEIIL